MPALRCPTCLINLPIDQPRTCTICGAQVAYMPVAAPDPDWQEIVAQRLNAADGDTAGEQVREWRISELERAGWKLDDAQVLAGRMDIDLHLALRLLRDGCPRDTALRILL